MSQERRFGNQRTGGFVWVSGGIRGAQKRNRIAVWPLGRRKVYFSEAGWYGVVVFFSHVYLLWCCGLIGKVLPGEYSWQREEGNGIGSEPNKERRFGGRVLDHWFGDPNGGEKLLESELTETSWERSELLVGCSKLRWWKRCSYYHCGLDCRAVPSSRNAKIEMASQICNLKFSSCHSKQVKTMKLMLIYLIQYS